MEPMSLDRLLPYLDQTVLPEHREIGLAWRERLWYALVSAYPSDGLLRLGVLSYLVAKDTLPAWLQIAHKLEPALRPLPQKLLSNCKALILKQITVSQADDYELHDVEYSGSLDIKFGTGAFSCLAAYAAINCVAISQMASNDEFLDLAIWADEYAQSYSEDNVDWEAWDTHFWASGVAGGFPGRPGFDEKKRAAFWRHWLQMSVPSALGTSADVWKRLDS